MFLFLSWLEQQMQCFKGKKKKSPYNAGQSDAALPVFLDLKHFISWSTIWPVCLGFHPIFGWEVAHQTGAEAVICS